MGNIFNTNDLLRKIIADNNEDIYTRRAFAQKIKLALMLNDKENEFIRKTIVPILFLDSYKQLSDRIKNNSASIEEIQMSSMYSIMESIEEINDLYNDRADFILYSVDAVYNFMKLPILGKIKIMKNLTDEEQIQLSKITELHEKDNKSYRKGVNEDIVFTSFDSFINNIEKTSLYIDDSTIAFMIAGFLQNIYPNNSAEIYKTVCNMNDSVMNNIEVLKDYSDADEKELESLADMYKEDRQTINKVCLVDIDTLARVVLFYCNARRMLQKDGKVLKNERHE